MNTKEINQAVENMRIPLSKSEKINLWINTSILTTGMGLIGSVSIDSAIRDKTFPTLLIVLIPMMVWLVYRTLTVNKLKVWKTHLTEDEFKIANEAASKLNDWQIARNALCFIANQHSNWTWEGIRITSILKDGKLYFNSMVNPAIRSTPFSFGNNSKNRNSLFRQYKQIIEGDDVTKLTDKRIEEKEAEFWNESELSPKNLAMKLIGYPLGFAFGAMAIWMISSMEITGVIYGAIVLGFVGKYFYYDWKVIYEKRKRKRKAKL